MSSSWKYKNKYVVTFHDKTHFSIEADQVEVKDDGSLVFFFFLPGYDGPIYALSAGQWWNFKRD